jgi:hypothetical protein
LLKIGVKTNVYRSTVPEREDGSQHEAEQKASDQTKPSTLNRSGDSLDCVPIHT